MSKGRPASEAEARIPRRTLMRWLVGVGAVSSLGAFASVIGTMQPRPQTATQEVEDGDRLVFALGSNKGNAITRTSILPGQAALAFPVGKEVQDNLIMVFHFTPQDLQAPTNLAWAPQGFVAYSALCTHLGCTVNYSHEAMEGAPFPHIHCPCHAGLFNPMAGGQVIGGPPPRPLPQLPLKLSAEGALLAAGPFSAPVGVL